ncbi:beta-N-acetylhexosaminidase [Paraphotobacterium marinum]|uniref:beta-N-acetylhexosaminidase n=1 Tax=Paraphotobacterium marinum TaxID=1755811 RepID=A0A220VGM4_9GAMM|nr:beta-N-acetylhexosaminidase [Paraphotobacterium marinum]ASK79479.1 beta-N-acetylhexosaminidase [Paraphotobacterium marinum]
MSVLLSDIDSFELDPVEKEMIQHPLFTGIILFSRNFYDLKQLKALTTEIRKVVKKPFLITVDQEGGLVQRFKQDFTPIPAAYLYHQLKNGKELAKQAGFIMASELMSAGVDLSFAPVLDIGTQSKAIQTRSFGDSPDEVLKYVKPFILGMKKAGMSVTGKHFPGHGSVVEDSHLSTPINTNQNIFEYDILPFQSLIQQNLIDAIMPAHIIFEKYNQLPACGSPFWLKDILRKALDFKGVIFSDDLNMNGANILGDFVQRAEKTLMSGCDLLLLCNNRKETINLLDNFKPSLHSNCEILMANQNKQDKNLLNNLSWKKITSDFKSQISI